jgi:hypothetical protein
MNFQKILYPLSVNVAFVVFWTAVVGHNNANYFWTNNVIAIATAINMCQVIRNAFDMLEKELDKVIRDSENEKPRPRPITVSDLINCIRAIGKIDVKMIRTYNFAIPKKPEPLIDKSWCNLDDTNILYDKRNANNVNYYELDDEDDKDDKLFRKKRVIHVKTENAMDAIEQEVINKVEIEGATNVDNEAEIEVYNEVETNVDNKVETEGATNVDNKAETNVSNKVETEVYNEVETNVDNKVETEVYNEVETNVDNKVETEVYNEVETNVDNKAETEGATNVDNKAETKDAEYVVVE